MSYRHYEIRNSFLSTSAVWRPMTLVMLAAFGLASQNAQAYSDDWVMGFHDSRHTGQTSEVVTPPLKVAWMWKDTYDYDSGNLGNVHVIPEKAFWLPVYYKGKVCFQGGLNANRVFCLNPADGAKIWESDNPGYTASGTYLFQFDNYPAIAAGRLIYVSTDFTATLDASTGLNYLNVYNVNGGWPSGGVASLNGTAYEQFIRTDDLTEQFSIIPNPSAIGPGSTTGLIGAYERPDNGNTFFDPLFRVPAVDAGVAYVNLLGRLEAWDAVTHKPLWAWGSSNYGSSPAVANGVVYLYNWPTSQGPGQLVALKASPTNTVSTLWSFNIEGAKSPIVSDGVVYVGSSDKNFYALDAATGARKWVFPTGAPFTALQIPAISGDLIYVPSADGNLYILQKSTGLEVVEGHYSGTAPWGPVVIGGGMIYASDLTNTVYAFWPRTAAIGPSETSVSLSRATNNGDITINLTGSGFLSGGGAGAVSIRLDNAAGTVLTGYTVASDQAINGIVVPAGTPTGTYHLKVRTNVGQTVNEPVVEVATNSNLPSLSVLETHSGNFSQGQTAGVYSVTVSNQTGAGPTSGTVTLTGTTTPGLTLVSMAGSGWACSGNTCTRSDVLNAGFNYAPVAVTVSAGASGPGSATNLATISGGGGVSGANYTATDPTIINPITDVSGQVKVTQTGFFYNRGTGIWSATLTVTNTSAAAINGPVQVVLSNLSVNATMVNNTGVRNGSPYITVAPGALAPGTSVNVAIQFTNPSHGYINFNRITDSGVL